MEKWLVLFVLIVACSAGEGEKLPTAETCASRNNGHEWHYLVPLSPITSSAYVGMSLDRIKYEQGTLIPIMPLFNELQVSISAPGPNDEFENATTISSSFRTVEIHHRKRGGMDEYHNLVDSLITEDFKRWNYSRDPENHRTTFFFLKGKNTPLPHPSFYNYQMVYPGIGVTKFAQFLFQYEEDAQSFPDLWPWMKEKLNPKSEVTVDLQVLIFQDAFTISHTPFAPFTNYKSDNNETDTEESVEPEKENDDLIQQQIKKVTTAATRFPRKKMAFISSIRYGEQVLIHLGIKSTEPFPHPKYSDLLIHGVKDLLSEKVTVNEFDESFPKVSFNLTLQQDSFTFTTVNGTELDGVTELMEINAGKLLEITNGWSTSVLTSDPINFFPVAIQARSFRPSNSSKKEPAGEILEVHSTACAIGKLPSIHILETAWEILFVLSLAACIVCGLFLFLGLGGVLHTLVEEGSLTLPFFLHIHPAAIRIRVLYIWW